MVRAGLRVLVISLSVLFVSSALVEKLEKLENSLDYPGGGGGGGFGGGCPLCDSSVYSYCTYKLVHDDCCCNSQYGLGLIPTCRYQDCTFLYSNSCYESNLIKTCCCNSPFYKK